jgi:hypothetical protein
MRQVGIVKTRKKLFITINMTTIAHRFDNGVQKRRNVDETMGTAQPPGQIPRWQRHSIRRMGVGFKGRWGVTPG